MASTDGTDASLDSLLSVQSKFCMTDITLERTGDPPAEEIAKICVFGLDTAEDGRDYTLSKESEKRWVVDGVIELPPGVDNLVVSVKTEDGVHVDSAMLDFSWVEGAKGCLPENRSQQMDMGDPLGLMLSWGISEIPDARTTLRSAFLALLAITEMVTDGLYKRLVAGNPSDCDISRAILTCERALTHISPGYNSFPNVLNMLGVAFEARFEKARHPSDLDKAIALYQRSIEHISPDDIRLASYIRSLANAFRIRFEIFGNLLDISEAITLYRRVVDISAEDPGPPRHLSNPSLATALHFKKLGHPHLASHLSDLGCVLQQRFERIGQLPDRDEAITVIQRAVDVTPQGHPNLPGFLSNLGNLINTRFKQNGQPADLESAISLHQKSVDLTPQGHPDLPSFLNNLSIPLTTRFEQCGQLADLERAISLLQRSVDLTPQEHQSLAIRLSNLGGALQQRAKTVGQLPDLDAAIAALQWAVDLTPQGHPDLPAILPNFTNALLGRFDQVGDLGDLANSIYNQQKLVDLTPPSHIDFPYHLVNLGMQLRTRFRRMENLSDLDDAATVLQRAVDLTPPSHSNLPIALNILATVFSARFHKLHEISDLESAISCQHKAIHLTPPDHPDRRHYMQHLASCLLKKSKWLGGSSDIVEAISIMEAVVDMTPPDHPDLPMAFNLLGHVLSQHFKQIGDEADLLRSITTYQQAVGLLSPEHPAYSVFAQELAASHFQYILHNGIQDPESANDFTIEHLESAISLLKVAAMCESGSPSTRMDSAILWARVAGLFGQEVQSLDSFAAAIQLLSVVAGLELTIEDRHTQLQKASNLSTEAASVVFSLGYPEKALEWLEHGRCLVWVQLNQLRTPVDKLCLHNPELAQKVLEVSKALESAGSRSSTGLPPISSPGRTLAEAEFRTHIHLAKEWESLLEKVRAIPGFEYFLKPAAWSSLFENLPGGPIVLINVHQKRCDAIALVPGRDAPFHIPLPNLSLANIESLRKRLKNNLDRNNLRVREPSPEQEESDRGSFVPVSRDGGVGQILEALWNNLVKPILDSLEFQRRPHSKASELPRIWWCPTGPLAFLPIHAAGIYKTPESPTIFDYAVSSYTPNITSLTTRMQAPRQAEGNQSGLFIVSQPDTPGFSCLPGTKTEVQNIKTQLDGHGIEHILMLEGDEATVLKGLTNMENFSCIHFACHAIQDPDEALRSGFQFHDGRLDLSTIIKKDLKNADFAFLSACQTSAGEEKLSEEAVHLAAGMLAAGYRGVVGTMWSISDKHAVSVSNDFYAEMLRRQEAVGRKGIDSTHAAYSLHHAIRNLHRSLDNSEKSLLSWVPFVHFGV